MKQWHRIDYKNAVTGATTSTEYDYGDMTSLCDRLREQNAPFYELNPCEPEEVPVVQRGLAEATTEELRDELAKRGWKVTA